MSKRPANSGTMLFSTMALFRRRFVADEQGATAIEYALIAAGIGATIAATVTNLGSAVNKLYQSIAAVFP